MLLVEFMKKEDIYSYWNSLKENAIQGSEQDEEMANKYADDMINISKDEYIETFGIVGMHEMVEKYFKNNK